MSKCKAGRVHLKKIGDERVKRTNWLPSLSFKGSQYEKKGMYFVLGDFSLLQTLKNKLGVFIRLIEVTKKYALTTGASLQLENFFGE